MQIKTERFTITRFSPDMAQAVYENSQDDDTRLFVPDEVYDSVEEAHEAIEFLMSRYESTDGPFVYPVITNNEGKNIGYVQLCKLDEGTWEIGYHIAKNFTGKGYATEAVKAFLPAMAKKTQYQRSLRNLSCRKCRLCAGSGKMWFHSNLHWHGKLSGERSANYQSYMEKLQLKLQLLIPCFYKSAGR